MRPHRRSRPASRPAWPPAWRRCPRRRTGRRSRRPSRPMQPMAKITKLVMITCTAFLEREKPVSTMAKPTCMKKTSAPPKIRKKMLSEILTWPSSAATHRRWGCRPWRPDVADRAGRRSARVVAQGQSGDHHHEQPGEGDDDDQPLGQGRPGPGDGFPRGWWIPHGFSFLDRCYLPRMVRACRPAHIRRAARMWGREVIQKA